MKRNSAIIPRLFAFPRTRLLRPLLAGALAATVCSALSAAEPRPLPIADWQRQIRANFFIPDPLPALAAETHRHFRPASGVRAEAVTYGSQFGLRVPAILYMPDPLPKTGSGKIPGLVIVNGHGGDKYSCMPFTRASFMPVPGWRC